MASPVLAGLLPEGVKSAEGDPAAEGCPERLFDVELQAIAKAVRSRREQYAATRHLARRLFSELGLEPQPVLNRPDRSPIWPQGYHGTLTHTDGWCAVALAAHGIVGGIGVDAERAEPMEVAILERILTPRELAAFELASERTRALGALCFSAKESLYKCVFPRVQRFIGFAEVEVSLDFEAKSFSASALGALDGEHGSLIRAVSGRFARHGELWVTTAVLPAR